MTLWNSMWSWIGGLTNQRNKGVQYTGPAQTEAAASTVTEETALQLSAVWACVRLISENVASLPVSVYEPTPQGRVERPDHWFNLVLRNPNRYQTSVEFWETMMLNLVLNGNAYARINRVSGKVRSLMPMMSSQIEVRMLDDGSLIYVYTSDGLTEVLAQESVWHVKLYGNGIIGMSPLQFGRNIFGIGQAAEKAVTNIYANGAKPSGVITFDRVLKPEQREQIRSSFANLTTGTDNRLMVLEAGSKFEAVSMSPQDIELLASRKFQIEEICRWFGVPSVLVNDTGGSTTWGSGIEQLVTGFYKLNLRPYLERTEASAKRWLLQEENVYIEFEFEGLLRSDLKTRLEGYRSGIAGGILTPNEARIIEGWPAKEGGDDLMMQVNMSPIQKLGQTGAQNAPQTTDA